jgi:lipopolysaccharide biosynthesis regulator YciM
MKQLSFLLLFFTFVITGFAQQNADSLQQTGRNYMRKGDWRNAIIVFNRALQLKPTDVDILNDIAYTYFLQRDFTHAIETINKVIDKDDADVRSFQIAGTNYRAIEDLKAGAKVYEKGLKKFPYSGVLYSEYGELLWQKKDYTAINQWETGIKVDPNYSGNYYNAARYYYFSTNKIWGLLYGEIFINLESYTVRTAEIKPLLYDGYKKLFTDADLFKGYKSKNKNDFEIAFLTAMNMQSSKATNGITPEKLIEIRKAFLQYWNETNAKQFPFRLFEYQQQLAKLNMFDAYNQWIFGSAISSEQYQTWIKNNKEAYQAFDDFQKGRVFKLPKDQYYQHK